MHSTLSKEYQEIVRQVSALSIAHSTDRASGVREVVHAVLAAEDRRFYLHAGIDMLGIARAALKFLSGKRLEGASTIEQQLVRTIRRRYEISLERKFTECLLAVALSRTFDKNTIAVAYLELAYFGWRANGIREACARLGVDLAGLTKAEAAAIAAMLKVPMPRAPSSQYRVRHSKRVQYILRNWDKVRA